MVTEDTALVRTIAQVSYFSGLPPAVLSEIAHLTRRRSIAAGARALTEGEACDGLYFVIRGQIRLVKVSAEGREQVLAVLGPGATFNDIAVFDGGPNPNSAVAIGPTVLGIVSRADMQVLIERYPQIAKAALKVLSNRQRTFGTIMEDLALREVATRIARLLLACIGEHEHIIERADEACARITQQEIASMVGSVREVVQRALKDLEHDGAVSLGRARVHIRDIAKLKQWAQIDDSP